ncbi:hypothetical protein JCGZ_09949 [Jatropha curcas]|uniref:Aminotransferase-like plant mobile domain-containing protein n=1 Tax=Jatropha curcas TaxID=180498 RepID=A0A067KWP6_JATCU|nr:hypothetical protein JCGZ_09949 [Jatropha curcas]
MRSRVIATGFGDYALGLHRTQPRFPPAMRYALMERGNDCTHSFIFGFGDMTLTPADFTAITGLGFDGDAVPLDSRYQTVALGAELVGSLLGVTTRTRYTAQGYFSYEVVYKFWAERIRARLVAWRELLEDVRPAAPAYTREERDQAARSFIFYIISSQLLCTSQIKGDPAMLACLWDLSLIGTYDWASLALAHLYHGLDVWAYEYRIYPGGPERDTRSEARRIPRYVVHRYHTYSSSEDPHYWRCYLNDKAIADLDRYYLGERIFEIHTVTAQRRVPIAPPHHMCTLDGMTPEDVLLEYGGFPADDYLVPGDYSCQMSESILRRRHRTPAFYRAQVEADVPAGPTGIVPGDVPFPPANLRQVSPQLQLDPEHATHVPAQRYQELYQRFCFAQAYIARLYAEHHGMTRQAAAISRLQMENDGLHTRLEVEGIPLDSSDEEEDDDDDSSSDDAPPPPPSSVRRAATGPSRRRR